MCIRLKLLLIFIIRYKWIFFAFDSLSFLCSYISPEFQPKWWCTREMKEKTRAHTKQQRRMCNATLPISVARWAHTKPISYIQFDFFFLLEQIHFSAPFFLLPDSFRCFAFSFLFACKAQMQLIGSRVHSVTCHRFNLHPFSIHLPRSLFHASFSIFTIDRKIDTKIISMN